MNVFVITTAALTLFTFMIQKSRFEFARPTEPEFYLIPPLGMFFYYISTPKTQSTYIKLQIVLSVVIAVFLRDIRVKYHSASQSMNALAKLSKNNSMTSNPEDNEKFLDIIQALENEKRI